MQAVFHTPEANITNLGVGRWSKAGREVFDLPSSFSAQQVYQTSRNQFNHKDQTHYVKNGIVMMLYDYVV